MRKLYRVQHPAHWGGAWYDADGNETRLVDSLTSKRLAEMPMSKETSTYRKDGKIWQCAAKDVDQLEYWFTEGDLAELSEKGYMICEFISNEYVIRENQVDFNRDEAENFRFFKTYDDFANGSETYTLPRKFAEDWLVALRSGEYGQGTSSLYTTSGDYCCLGVACYIKGASIVDLWDKGLILNAEWGDIRPKFFSNIPVQLRGTIDEPGLIRELVSMNDSGKTFAEIADWIEKNVLFVD